MALGQIPVAGSGVGTPGAAASSFAPANPLAPIPPLAQLPADAAIGNTQVTSDQGLVYWNGTSWVSVAGSTSSIPRYTAASSVVLASTDNGNLVIQNDGAIPWTLGAPQVGTNGIAAGGFQTIVQNGGTAAGIFTPTTSTVTVNGVVGASATIPPYAIAFIWTDATVSPGNYVVLIAQAGYPQAGGGSYVLAQGGIPLILPSSGTMGNNGALSALTALPTTYASCYMFFAAGVIAAGSLAGMYYVTMSSATAGTVFNNTYTTGIPTIPATPTPFVTTGPGAYVQSTSIQTLMSVSLPANSLGNNGQFRTTSLWALTATNNSKTISEKLGSSVTWVQSPAVSTSVGYDSINVTTNQGATSAQASAPRGTVGSGVVTSAGQTYTTVNTALTQTITLNGTLSVATDYIVLDSFLIEVFPTSP
jgi:hypothetical protein